MGIKNLNLKELRIISLSLLLLFALTNLIAQNFTIGTIPDTQNMTENDSEQWKTDNMCKFFVDHRDSLNLIFVASLGDMTQWGADDQWERIRKSYTIFDSAQLAYAPCQGNHDWNLEHFKQWFPVKNFESNPKSFYAGSFENNIANAYYLFSASGVDFIVVVLQSNDQYLYERKGFSWPSIHWANYIISQHPNRKAILITHDFFESRVLIDAVITKHDNLVLAICGHSCAREKYWTEKSPSKNTVHCIMTDYQCDKDKGATVRYYTFIPDKDMVCAYTYNVVTNTYEKDADSEFCFNIPMKGKGPWASIIQPQKIYEGEENNQTISLQLNQNLFVKNLKPDNWQLTNLPVGVSIGNLERINDTLATITLKGNSAIGTYTSDVSTISLKINKEELQIPLQFYEIQGIKMYKSVPPILIPGRIEAEDFMEMEGIKVSNANDNGPAKNIGYLAPNDWVVYKIKVAQTGKYNLHFRTSSLKTNGKIHVQINNKTIITPEIQQTGSWDNWTTSTFPIELTSGECLLKLFVITGDFNINWMEIEIKK